MVSAEPGSLEKSPFSKTREQGSWAATHLTNSAGTSFSFTRRGRGILAKRSSSGQALWPDTRLHSYLMPKGLRELGAQSCGQPLRSPHSEPD